MAQQKYKSEPIKEGQKKSNIKHQSFGTQALPPPKPTAITKTNKPMEQQTAVEFLIESIDADARGLWTKELRKKAEQAKRMFEEQIEKAFGAGNTTIDDWDDSSKKEYYTKTYGK